MNPVMLYKNIAIIGGSFSAIAAKLRSLGKLPEPYRLVIIEPRSHFQYVFAFPRACVLPGFENDLFVPYNKLFDSPAQGIVVTAKADSITPTHVILDRPVSESIVGISDSKKLTKEISYDYLIYAAGANHPPPTNLNSSWMKEDGIAKLKEYQLKIRKAEKILVVGGGAAGLELAAEIKEKYPEKSVTLVHSRTMYLTPYKKELHEYAYQILKRLGVEQILGERVMTPKDEAFDGIMRVVETNKGRKIECDLQIMCTGLTPNSSVLSTLSPSAINPDTNFVKVKSTMQIDDVNFPNIFAVGDIIDSPEIKTAKTALQQASTSIDNIIKLINHKNSKESSLTLNDNKPSTPRILLYLGKQVIGQMQTFWGASVFQNPWFTWFSKSQNLGASKAWSILNIPFNKETAKL
ncbi:Apoptosis-inducing factor 2 [Nowakowskiella sp. JEL0078]|nr:Apoptosis-inducing factor 2 [Nowakowskiella sp. JEL0078]